MNPLYSVTGQIHSSAKLFLRRRRHGINIRALSFITALLYSFIVSNILYSYPGYGYGGIPIFGLSDDIRSKQDVWLTAMTCDGSENSLYNCTHSGWDVVGGGEFFLR